MHGMHGPIRRTMSTMNCELRPWLQYAHSMYASLFPLFVNPFPPAHPPHLRLSISLAPTRRYHVGVVQTKARFFGASKLKIFVNGNQLLEKTFPFPSNSKRPAVCAVGLHMSGQVGKTYLSSEAISSPAHVAELMDCQQHPSSVPSISGMTGKLIFGYHPAHCTRPLCLDIGPGARHAIKLAGTHDWILYPFRENIASIGGMKVVLPLLNQLRQGFLLPWDMPRLTGDATGGGVGGGVGGGGETKGEDTAAGAPAVAPRISRCSSYDGHSMLAKVIRLLAMLLRNHPANQADLLCVGMEKWGGAEQDGAAGVRLLSFFLEQMPPAVLAGGRVASALQELAAAPALDRGGHIGGMGGKSAIENMHRFGDISDILERGLLRHVMFNFMIWSRAPLDTQEAIVSLLKANVMTSPAHMRRSVGLLHVLHQIRRCYGLDSDAAELYGASQLVGNAQWCRIRGSILEAAGGMVLDKISEKEVNAILGLAIDSFVCTRDASLAQDTLKLLGDLLDRPTPPKGLFEHCTALLHRQPRAPGKTAAVSGMFDPSRWHGGLASLLLGSSLWQDDSDTWAAPPKGVASFEHLSSGEVGAGVYAQAKRASTVGTRKSNDSLDKLRVQCLRVSMIYTSRATAMRVCAPRRKPLAIEYEHAPNPTRSPNGSALSTLISHGWLPTSSGMSRGAVNMLVSQEWIEQAHHAISSGVGNDSYGLDGVSHNAIDQIAALGGFVSIFAGLRNVRWSVAVGGVGDTATETGTGCGDGATGEEFEARVVRSHSALFAEPEAIYEALVEWLLASEDSGGGGGGRWGGEPV